MPTFDLGGLDLSIVVLYILFVVWLGLRFARRHETAEEYFLAGRNLTWPIIGLSLFATQMSSSTLVGMMGSGYETGYAVYIYAWFAAFALIIFALFFLPYYLKNGLYTMPEYLERRFDGRARYYHSAISIVGNIMIDMAGALYAGALLVELVFPSVPLWQSIAVLAVVTGLYTISGGLAAVVYTDTAQAVLLAAGTLVIGALAWSELGGSWAAVREATTPAMRGLVRPADDSFLPWPGILTGVPLLGIYYWCSNQAIVQRALGAKTLRHGQWGALFAGLLHLPVIVLLVLPGTAARALYPGLETSNLVFPALMFGLLPAGVLGLVLAGFVAALMSSIDSALNSASSLATMDFYRAARPAADQERLMWVGRVFTLLFVAIAAVWAPQIDRFPTFWNYLQSVLAYITPPIAACFLFGLFWKRATAPGALAALIGGGLGGLVLLVARSALDLAWLHFLYVAFILFVLSAGLLVGVSLATDPPPPEKTDEQVWNADVLRRDEAALAPLPWYLRPRVLASGLSALTLAVFALLW